MKMTPSAPPATAAALAATAGAAAAFVIGTLRLGVEPPAPWSVVVVLALPLGMFFAAFAWAARFPCQATPLGRATLARLAATHVSAALVTAAVWVGAGRAWAGLVDRVLPEGAGAVFAARFPAIFALGLVGYCLAIAAHYSASAARAARDAALRESEARALQRESELRALRQQVSPHFLFNCLNTISALIGAEPAAARRGCEQLAELLRRTLTLGEMDRVPFDDELRLVESFLELERLRFGARLRPRFEIGAAARERLVPPLLLLPLVENAVTHGVATLVDGGEVSVRASTAADRLTVTIENARDGASRAGRGSGLGMEHVRRRLATAFGTGATLRTSETRDRFRVDLDLPAPQTR